MTAETLRDYSPKNVEITWEGVTFKGLAEDFLAVSPSVDLTTAVVGADGSVAISISPDESGTVDITLLQTSETNLQLNGILTKQIQAGVIVRGNMTINDPSGATALDLRGAHIMKRPEVSLGIEQTNKTWTFHCSELIYSVPDDLPEAVKERINSFLDGVENMAIKNAKDFAKGLV